MGNLRRFVRTITRIYCCAPFCRAPVTQSVTVNGGTAVKACQRHADDIASFARLRGYKVEVMGLYPHKFAQKP